MIKKLIYLLFAFGLAVLSCQENMNEPPMLQKKLARTQWQLQEFVSENGEEMAIGRPRYTLEFVNDSILTVKLDANRYIGRYGSKPSGEFTIKSLSKAGNVCCDSEQAQLILEKILYAHSYKSNEGRLWLSGMEEVIFMEHKINQ